MDNTSLISKSALEVVGGDEHTLAVEEADVHQLAVGDGRA